MGAYLSEPVTTKESTDGHSERLSYGASSMQGWRLSQEDAHNCIVDFDKECSFFAVYDGHGGAEVAKYTADNLPKFLKSTKLFTEGKISESLVDAFMKFDESLTYPEVLEELKKISEVDSGDSNLDDVDILCKEASMPLEELISRYREANTPDKVAARMKQLQEEKPKSPRLFARPNGPDGVFVPQNTKSSPKLGKSKLCNSDPSSEESEVTSNTTVNGYAEDDHEKREAVDSVSNQETSESKEASKSGGSGKKKDLCVSDNTVTESSCSDSNIESFEGPSTSTGEKYSNVSSTTDAVSSSEERDVGEEIGSSEASCSKAEPKVKERVDESKKEAGEVEDNEPGSSSDVRQKLKFSVLGAGDADDDSDDDEDDEDVDSADLEEEDDDSESSREDDEWKDNNEEEEDDEEEEDPMLRGEMPGFDSGCTACVAVLHGNTLYVANAGDSRCILARDGEAIDLSLDHKPEDDIERNRIEKAGGEVTPDGRVNGGLNLSRAIGDHSYKVTANIPPEEQMIIAQPDIKTIDIDYNKDSFIVLACDGIWNVKSSQEVVTFVSERLNNKKELPLSKICEELFDECLSENTLGDGTGCDNMTCIIIKVNKPSDEPSSSSSVNSSAMAEESVVLNGKRTADQVESEPDVSVEPKRIKTEEDIPSS